MGVAGLCSKLLSEFSSNEFETLHRYYKLIEDLHAIYRRNFNKIYSIVNLGIFDFDISDFSVS